MVTWWMKLCSSLRYVSFVRHSLKTCFITSVWSPVSQHLLSVCECVCVALWTVRQRASHSLYMVTMWGANKVLWAALIWPSDQSQYLTVTTLLSEGSLEGCPSHIRDCCKWSVWQKHIVRAAGEWEQSGCVDVFVSAAVTHSQCIISLADGL